jgi:Ni,Fe-hydrogenase III large subunit
MTQTARERKVGVLAEKNAGNLSHVGAGLRISGQLILSAIMRTKSRPYNVSGHEPIAFRYCDYLCNAADLFIA